MGWQDPPQAGERWRRKGKPMRGVPTETRTVVDRTLGGDIVFIRGRVTYAADMETCTEREWAEWCARARKLVDRA
jgi:hypothetical protein